MTSPSIPAPPLRGLLAANLICMGSMLIWAAGLPAADHLIPLLPHEQLNALRVGLAGLTLIPVWALMEGLRPLVRKSCDVLYRLPMAGSISSLNAAVAGSIALYHVLFRRSTG